MIYQKLINSLHTSDPYYGFNTNIYPKLQEIPGWHGNDLIFSELIQEARPDTILEIGSWKEKKIEDLSKGMAQKVQFISTIIHEPPLLILDEPFSGFDPVNAELIKNEILELKENGTTVILSTHRMESVELLCVQVAMINRSKKILDSTIKEVKKSFRPEVYSIAIEEPHQLIPQEWTAKEDDGTYYFTLPLSGKSPNELLNELMQYGQVKKFQEVIPSMEEIFIHQVKAAQNG